MTERGFTKTHSGQINVVSESVSNKVYSRTQLSNEVNSWKISVVYFFQTLQFELMFRTVPLQLLDSIFKKQRILLWDICLQVFN